MSNYGELSRRGLIKLNNDFDKANENQLKNFLDSSDTEYEGIRPFEAIAERMDEVSEVVKKKSDTVSQAMMDRVNHMFDSVINSMTEEIDRCESVMDEQNDNEEYPDDVEVTEF